jgi:predicted aspartyl protease
MNGIEKTTAKAVRETDLRREPKIMPGLRVIIWFLIAAAFYGQSRNLAIAKAASSESSSAGWTVSAQNHLLVSVIVNGHQAWFGIDTGSPFSAVDLRQARFLGLTAITGSVHLPKRVEVNSREAPVARINQLTVGSDNLGSGPVVLIDLHGFPEFRRGGASRLEMAGIIGLDILQKYRAIIDYQNHRLLLELPGEASAAIVGSASAHHKIPMRLTKSGALEVTGQVGTRPYGFIVDTGSAGSVVPLEVAVDNRLSVRWSKLVSRMVNFAPSLVGRATIPTWRLGDYSLGRSSAYVTAMPAWSGDLQHPFGGLIGNDFFLSRNAIIDVEHRIIYVK